MGAPPSSTSSVLEAVTYDVMHDRRDGMVFSNALRISTEERAQGCPLDPLLRVTKP